LLIPMKILRAYRTELAPNNEQRTALMRHCGAARWVYNWGLARKIEAREKGEKSLNAHKLDGVLRAIMDEECPWLREINSYARQRALANLDNAYKNFFDRCKKGKKGRATGFPKFKSRKKGVGSYTTFHYLVHSDKVRLACIGWVRLKQSGYLPLGGYGKNTETVRFYGARITERAGRWYVSVQVEIEVPDAKPQGAAVGVDVGIKAQATCSNGLVFSNPKALESSLKKLKCLSRAQSRKFEASKKSARLLRECKNFQKGKRKLARLHARIVDLRTHHLHHASHVITRKSSVIGVESLNVAGMMKNRHLAKAVADASFGELLRQIQYKAQWRGGQVVVADRWFASSKTCHACGVVNADLTLSQRKWLCECGVSHERDLNAAHNLMNMAASRAVTACGEGSS
ncbi:MAG: transposase, partial [Cytophagaceae bacterium]